jgi:hypothetical protein
MAATASGVYAKASRNGTTSIDPEATKRFGLGSTTTREMLTLLEELNAGTHFPPAMKQALLTCAVIEDRMKERGFGSGHATAWGVSDTPVGTVRCEQSRWGYEV